MTANSEKDRNIDSTEKASRYILAMKIKQSKGAADLTVEEVAKIKQLVGEVMTTLVVGAAFDLLENKKREEENR